MSRENGQLVKCDRCGRTIFLMCTGTGETDGGFTRWNTFEPMPKGWGRQEIGDLCPECTAKWEELKVEFLKLKEQFMKGEKENADQA